MKRTIIDASQLELEEKVEGIKNYQVEVKEKGEDVIFLRKIIKDVYKRR